MKEMWGVVDVIPGQLFYVLLTNVSSKPIHVPNRMVLTHAMNLLNTIAGTEISLIYCGAENSSDMLGRDPSDAQIFVAAVNYTPTFYSNVRTEQHHMVENTNSERLKHKWEDEVHLSVFLTSYGEVFMTMIFKFHSIYDGHSSCITAAKYSIKLLRKSTQSILSVLYREGSKSREFKPI